MEQTLIIIKPDGVRRNLTGKILSIFESKGLRLCNLSFTNLTDNQVKKHYNKFLEKDFFPRILKFMTSGPVVIAVFEGYNAIKYTRKLIGATNPIEAEPNTIRGMFATGIEENVIHASENISEFNRERTIYFQ